MHLARVRRHGYPELKKDAYSSLEKLPHLVVDNLIRKNCQKIIDKEIVKILKKRGYKNANVWTVRYRRRKLGIKKYLYGEIKKHKAWIRTQAIEKYGDKCELCGYSGTVDTHHIIPKKMGGPHETNNLIVICPNCHALITRKYLNFKKREDIPKVRVEITKLLKSFYPNLG
jgi:5-methylcytosine-specific restriction endonuclease McrA